PETVGSKSWESSLPRMVTWVELEDKRNADAKLFYFNTHFDHMSPKARLNSAKLLRQRIGEISRGDAVILTGDFNSGEGAEPYKALFGRADGAESPVVDCFRKVH